MMDNQCANIFSTHATVYGSHNAMFAFYWKREYFFLHVYPQLSFLKKLGLCLCIYSHPLYFSPKLFFLKLVFAWLDWYLIVARPIETEKFSISKFLTKLFFMHQLCLGFTCIALFSVFILQFCSHISHCFHT